MVRSKYRSFENESFIATTSYANAVMLDLKDTGDNILHIKNMDNAITIQYKIYATPKSSKDIPDDNHDSWYNILNSSGDTYDHNKETSLLAGVITRESLSNKYAWMRVQIKSASGTPTVKLWHRGNQYS